VGPAAIWVYRVRSAHNGRKINRVTLQRIAGWAALDWLGVVMLRPKLSR